jgi:2-polyprenyl-3-methyl-5-hydroxy-6-metoxy-1,4-benzoquinol methylase
MPHDLNAERARLAALAPDFSSEEGFNARLIDYRFDAIRPFLRDTDCCIELGSADGRMTEQLARCVSSLVAVDGSELYVHALHRRVHGVTAVCSLFEEFEPEHSPDVVVMAHVLEHVADPVALLTRVRGYLAYGGRAIVTVPNADSLHRHVGVALGLLAATTELNEADERIGHRRVYTKAHLLSDLDAAGFRLEHVGGVFLKPLSNTQIEEQWTPALQDAFFDVGHRYPELCAELLVVAG